LINKIKVKLEGKAKEEEDNWIDITLNRYPTRKKLKTKLNSLTVGNLAHLGKLFTTLQ
jgi:hypothetical protein